MIDNNNYCVIMAGGIGSRFWPKSRTSCPKQFLDILGVGRTLLQQTFDRFSKICMVENILVVTLEPYVGLVAKQIPELPTDNILAEPIRRNTAPCIAYACFKIRSLNPNANIVVSPSDHYIGDEFGFEMTITRGLQFTQFSKSLLTIGIIPTRPETGYGYIQIDSRSDQSPLAIHEVTKAKLFTEKPELDMAKTFIESREFFWNSGIFMWNVNVIIEAYREFLPDIYSLFSAGADVYDTPAEKAFISKVYSECPHISIDYGIMESHRDIYVIPALFPWSDLGTWRSLYENTSKDISGNVVNCERAIIEDTTASIISCGGKLVVVEGLHDYIVAESDGILLVIPRADEKNIKNLVNAAKLKYGEGFA